jgi:hypothetical protein
MMVRNKIRLRRAFRMLANTDELSVKLQESCNEGQDKRVRMFEVRINLNAGWVVGRYSGVGTSYRQAWLWSK